ncbi:MAG: TIM barrel protein, partial [Planctomycetia bacterium]|nr:TIM barrel protein [Planctomycetia bacterium]
FIGYLWSSLALAQGPYGVGTTEEFHGPVGIQMYSLREYCKLNVEAGLKLAAGLGFQVIEPSTTFHLSVEDYKKLMDQYGLKAISRNFDYGKFTTDEGIDSVIRDAKAFGVKYVGTAWFPHEKPLTEEAMKKVVAVFNHAGERLAKEGLFFTFHNHGFEFEPWSGGKEGETLYDMLIQQTDPRYVGFELDIRWIKAPTNPLELFQKYPNRWKLMHLKCESGSEGMLLEESTIDWRAILKASQDAGVEAWFLEYDDVRNIVPNTMRNLHFLESLNQ